MTISTMDQLVNSMANNSSRIILDKASLANATAGQFFSLWRASGQPGSGTSHGPVINVMYNGIAGAIKFINQTSPSTSYLGILEGLCSNASTTIEIHDRLCTYGGIITTLTTPQSVGMDLGSITTYNIPTRKGDSNYSDVQWWLEWYTQSGSTATTATVNVTYNDGSTGNLNPIAVAATRRVGFMQPLNGFIPSADSGKYIRGVNGITFSVSSGTAGGLFVTASRYRTGLYMPLANTRYTADWVSLGLPEIYNESALFAIVIAGTTSTGTVRATGKIIHG